MKVRFQVAGMTCSSCESSLEHMLQDETITVRNENNEEIKIKIIEKIDARFASGLLTVTFKSNLSDAQLKQAKIKIIESSPFPCTQEAIEHDVLIFMLQGFFLNFFGLNVPSKWLHLILGILGIAAGVIVMVLMMTFVIPMTVLYYGLMAGSIFLTLLLGIGSYVDAFEKLILAKDVSMNTLFSISTFTVICTSVANLFFSHSFHFFLPSVMFDAGLFVFGFMHIGDAIKISIKEEIAKRQTLNSTLLFDKSAAKNVQRRVKKEYELVLISGEERSKERLIEFECRKEGFFYRINGSDLRSFSWENEKLCKDFPRESKIILADKSRYLPEILSLISEDGHAIKKDEYTWEIYPAEKLKPGDVIRVGDGKIIPVDGICLSKEAWINQFETHGFTAPVYVTAYEHSLMSGEFSRNDGLILDNQADVLPEMQNILSKEANLPAKEERKNILAGMVPVGNLIEMEVTNTVKKSHLAEKAEKCEERRNERSEIEETAKRILRYLIPAILLIALIVGVAIGIYFGVFPALQLAALLLVSVCPCSLALLTPLAVKMGIEKAINYGIEFQSDMAVERASKIDIVAFDMNGTLTTGKHKVLGHDFYGIKKNTEEDRYYLDCLAVLEKDSQHAIGKKIREYAEQHNNHQTKIKNIVYGTSIETSGRMTRIDGVDYFLGSENFLRENGFEINNETGRKIKNNKPEASHIVYFAKRYRDEIGEIIGHVTLSDPLREEVPSVVKKLQDAGKKVVLITSGDRQTAEYVAGMAGILTEDVYANVPGIRHQGVAKETLTKDELVKLLKEEGRVCFVGEGGNDAAAIAAASCGVVIDSESSSENTKAFADVIISGGSLTAVLGIFSIAEETVNSIWMNIFLSQSYNFVFLASCITLASLGLSFALNPAFGAAMMVMQVIFLIGFLYVVSKRQVPDVKRIDDLVNDNQPESTHGFLHGKGLRPQNGLACNKQEQVEDISNLELDQDSPRETMDLLRRQNVVNENKDQEDISTAVVSVSGFNL